MTSADIFQEAESGRITFPEIEPETMAPVILFMYTRNYHACRLPGFYKKLINDDTEDAEDEEDDKNRYPGSRALLYHVGDIDRGGLRSALKVNAWMYQCADILGFEHLRQVTCCRLMDYAKLAYRMDGFEEFLRVVYKSTRLDDKDLRFQVTCMRIEHCDLLESQKKTIAVIEEYNPNLWNVSLEVNKRKESVIRSTIDSFNRKVRRCSCHRSAPMSKVQLKLHMEGGVLSIAMNRPVCSPERY